MKFIEKVIPSILFVNVIGIFFVMAFTKILELFEYDGGSFVTIYIAAAAILLVAATAYIIVNGMKEIMSATWSAIAPVNGAMPQTAGATTTTIAAGAAGATTMAGAAIITDEVIEEPHATSPVPTAQPVSSPVTVAEPEPQMIADSSPVPDISEEEMAEALGQFDSSDDWYPSEEELAQFM